MKKIIFTLITLFIIIASSCSEKSKTNQSKLPVSHPTKDSTKFEGAVLIIEAIEELGEVIAEDAD